MSSDEYYLPGARKSEVRAHNAWRESRKQIEIYRVAAQIFTLLRASYGPHLATVPGNRDEMHEAVREAIELWEKVEKWLTEKSGNMP